MKRLAMMAAALQLGRSALNRRRRVILRRQRRNRVVTSIALGLGMTAALYLLRDRGAEAPAWPSRKKQRKDARRAVAAQRAQERPAPGPVHVEREAARDLKVPLAEVKR